MCGRKSKTGAKRIVVLLLLLLLVALPCWSASPWPGLVTLFGGKAPTGQESHTSSQGSVASSEEVAKIQDSSQTAYTEPSQMLDQESLEELKSAVSELRKEFTESQTALEEAQSRLSELKETSTALNEQLETLKETEAISEADYTAVKESLVSNVNANKSADDIIAEYTQRLAEAEKARGSKGILMFNATVGFKENIPEYGVGMTLGLRLGNHIMITAGADYMIGNFRGTMYLNGFSLDHLRVTCGIGWMF